MQNGQSNHNVHPIANEVVGSVAQVGTIVVAAATTAATAVPVSAAVAAIVATAGITAAGVATAGAVPTGHWGVVGYGWHCAAGITTAAVAIDGI